VFGRNGPRVFGVPRPGSGSVDPECGISPRDDVNRDTTREASRHDSATHGSTDDGSTDGYINVIARNDLRNSTPRPRTDGVGEAGASARGPNVVRSC